MANCHPHQSKRRATTKRLGNRDLVFESVPTRWLLPTDQRLRKMSPRRLLVPDAAGESRSGRAATPTLGRRGVRSARWWVYLWMRDGKGFRRRAATGPRRYVIMEPSGWTVEQHDGYVSRFPPTHDAELRVTEVDLNPPGLEPSQWLAAVVRANRRVGRAVSAAQYGSFTGYSVDISALGMRIRGWFLHSGPRAIVVTYRGPESIGTRDDTIVRAALPELDAAIQRRDQ
jgi:hypothetical protein